MMMVKVCKSWNSKFDQLEIRRFLRTVQAVPVILFTGILTIDAHNVKEAFVDASRV